MNHSQIDYSQFKSGLRRSHSPEQDITLQNIDNQITVPPPQIHSAKIKELYMNVNSIITQNAPVVKNAPRPEPSEKGSNTSMNNSDIRAYLSNLNAKLKIKGPSTTQLSIIEDRDESISQIQHNQSLAFTNTSNIFQPSFKARPTYGQ